MTIINSQISTTNVNPLPDQNGHNGDFLTTNGTDASWASINQVPATTGTTQGDVLTIDANGDPAWQAGSGGLPSQTGNAGKFLTTDGTDASWSDKPLVNTATGARSANIAEQSGSTGVLSGNNSTIINCKINSNINKSGFFAVGKSLGTTFFDLNPGASSVSIVGDAPGANSVAIGNGKATGAYSTVINALNNNSSGDHSIAIGANCMASALNSIQIGHAVDLTTGTNSDANTFKVANANGNFMMMDANGNLPADRLASTNGLADGNYRLRLTMASGVPTLSWVAE